MELLNNEKLTNGGLDKTKDQRFLKAFLEFANSDGFLKALIWTIVGGSRTISYILGTIAYIYSSKDSLCLSIYLFFLLCISGLYQAAEFFLQIKKND